MKRIIDKLTQAESKDKEGRQLWRPRYFFFLGLLGLLLIIMNTVFSEGKQEEIELSIDSGTEQNRADSRDEEYINHSEISQLAKSYEQDLAAMLNNIQGVSEAEIMVNLDSSDILVYEHNLIAGTQTTKEEDQSGGTREVEDRTEETQVVLVRQGDREVPLLVQTKRPEVRGVFVAAKGAEKAVIKSQIIEAISSVLDVPVHRISVMAKE